MGVQSPSSLQLVQQPAVSHASSFESSHKRGVGMVRAMMPKLTSGLPSPWYERVRDIRKAKFRTWGMLLFLGLILVWACPFLDTRTKSGSGIGSILQYALVKGGEEWLGLQNTMAQRQTLGIVGEDMVDLEEDRVGGGRGLGDKVNPEGLPLVIYEEYHGIDAWPFLRVGQDLYRGLALGQGVCRPVSTDLDAVEILPALADPYYQKNAGEYGGMFAIAKSLEALHSKPWIGFQSWRAKEKGKALEPLGESALINATSSGNKYANTLIFWAENSGNPELEVEERDPYGSCDKTHRAECSSMMVSALRDVLNRNAEEIPSLPVLPSDDVWSYASYWAMPVHDFESYIRFAQLMLASLDSIYFGRVHDDGDCPMYGRETEYMITRGARCYSFLLERLVNMWAYHTNMRMVFLNPHTGVLQECHPLESRQWVQEQIFAPESLAAAAEEFPQRLERSNDRGFLRNIGWVVS